jgi:hypothetical protein
MPRLIVTRGGVIGMERCRHFLKTADQGVSLRAAKVIARYFGLLEKSPEAGRVFPLDQALRELVIPFGKTGYVALYRHEPDEDTVYILAFRHQREAGY